jgi:site-specific DNA recombinase
MPVATSFEGAHNHAFLLRRHLCPPYRDSPTVRLCGYPIRAIRISILQSRLYKDMRYFIYCRKSTEADDRQVASIESQLTTLQRTFGSHPEIEIADIYEESFSAKAPGRLQFGAMLDRIDRGEAQGIVAWAPDRLARNSIDGGRIVYMLDCGVLRDLKFATYTFENNSQGKFMVQIMFGQSKYYSDALSDNVKRGNRTKIEKGWRPNQSPLGYLNDPATKTIITDAVHFPLIRKMFDRMLSGAYTPKQIALTARDEWGFRTPQRRKIGGVPLAMSSIYKILSNPFYAGLIEWDGQIYPGKHKPVVTIDEFDRVRSLLGQAGPRKPQRYSFPFTGMIRCGDCGLAVTAEHKRNRYGHRYVYYHCSRSGLARRCTQPSIERRQLEKQIMTFLQSLTLHPNLEAWAKDQMKFTKAVFKREEEARRRSLQTSLEDIMGQLRELTGLRIRGLLTDAEFTSTRENLQKEELRLRGTLSEINSGSDEIEPFRELILFRNKAANWFLRGHDESKRIILESVGSNLFLKDKTVSIVAKKPFSQVSNLHLLPHRLRVVDDVRTFDTRYDQLSRIAHKVRHSMDNEDGKQILRNIKILREQFEPQNRPSQLPSNQAKVA